jgi:hypothetical protein
MFNAAACWGTKRYVVALVALEVLFVLYTAARLGARSGSFDESRYGLERSAQSKRLTITWCERTHSYFGEYDVTAFRPHGHPSTFQVLSRRSRLAPFRRGTT